MILVYIFILGLISGLHFTIFWFNFECGFYSSDPHLYSREVPPPPPRHWTNTAAVTFTSIDYNWYCSLPFYFYWLQQILQSSLLLLLISTYTSVLPFISIDYNIYCSPPFNSIDCNRYCSPRFYFYWLQQILQLSLLLLLITTDTAVLSFTYIDYNRYCIPLFYWLQQILSFTYIDYNWYCGLPLYFYWFQHILQSSLLLLLITTYTAVLHLVLLIATDTAILPFTSIDCNRYCSPLFYFYWLQQILQSSLLLLLITTDTAIL